MSSFCPPVIAYEPTFPYYGGLYRGKWLEAQRTRDPVEPKSFIKPDRSQGFNIAAARAQHDGSGKTLYARSALETLSQDAHDALSKIKANPSAEHGTNYLAIERLIVDTISLHMGAVQTQDASFSVLIDYLRRGQIYAYGSRPSRVRDFIDGVSMPFCKFAESYTRAKLNIKAADQIKFQLDKNLISLILTNLLSNAIGAASKIKEKDSKINLEVKLITPINKPRKLHFTITNPGKIEEDQLKSLGLRNISKQGDGHGIGLVSVGDMVRAHHGELKARNYPENGQDMVEISYDIQEMNLDRLFYPPTGT